MILQVCLRIPASKWNQEIFSELIKTEKKKGNIRNFVSYKHIVENGLKFIEVVLEINDKIR